MEAFRTLIKGWVGKVLLVIFLVPFALVGMEGLFSLGSKAGVAATVNKNDVSTNELDQALNQRRQQLNQHMSKGRRQSVSNEGSFSIFFYQLLTTEPNPLTNMRRMLYQCFDGFRVAVSRSKSHTHAHLGFGYHL